MLTENENIETVENENRGMCNKECPRDKVREEMIMKIRELDFAIVELGLYLDTHPDDQRAL